jgi:hypothetical protein
LSFFSFVVGRRLRDRIGVEVCARREGFEEGLDGRGRVGMRRGQGQRQAALFAVCVCARVGGRKLQVQALDVAVGGERLDGVQRDGGVWYGETDVV